MERQLRHVDTVSDIKVQNSTMMFEEKKEKASSYSQNNCTCKFTSEICMVLFHNVKNMMAGGNKINVKKHSGCSSCIFYNWSFLLSMSILII